MSEISNDSYLFSSFATTHSLGTIQSVYRIIHVLFSLRLRFFYLISIYIFNFPPLEVVIWVTLGSDVLHEIRKQSSERCPRLGLYYNLKLVIISHS